MDTKKLIGEGIGGVETLNRLWLWFALASILVIGIAFVVRADQGGSKAAAPAGMKTVSFHGVEILVPANMVDGPTECGTPLADTVIIEDGSPVETCLREQVPGLTVVTLAGLDTDFGRQLGALANENTQVDGHKARWGRGKSGRTYSVLAIPHVGVIVAVESPDRERTRRLLGTVRVTPVDSVGCPDHVGQLAPDGPSRRAGARRQLMSERATSIIVCRYDGLWLSRSVKLSKEEVTRAREVLNRLALGISREPLNERSPEACVDDEGRGFVLHVSTRFLGTEQIYAVISGCGKLGVTNGSTTRKLNTDVVDFLTSVAGYAGGFKDPNDLL